MRSTRQRNRRACIISRYRDGGSSFSAELMTRKKTSNRLFIAQPLASGAKIDATAAQANYLLNVLRLGAGSEVTLFDGINGEWQAIIREPGKRSCVLEVTVQLRPQEEGPDLHYLFAPVKRTRLDFMVEKATELGVAAIRPVFTSRTVAKRVKLDRMRANAIEAAEQCGVLRVPDIHEPEKLETVLRNWDGERHLVYCDEQAPVSSPLDALRDCEPGPLGVLIGPEGGFDKGERAMLRAQPFILPLSLGPRVMRADTAAVAALTLVNAALGDWR